MRYVATGAVSLMVSGLLLGALPASAATVTTYDLKNNWSDSHNPHGPWTYRQGTSALPADSDWTPLSTNLPEYNPRTGHIAQPAWAPGNISGDFLPGWFKSKVDVSSDSFDWKAKDVVVHTTDIFNGDSNGPANVMWTCPIAGTAAVSGFVWNARNIGRNQSWQVLVNGVIKKSGSLPGNGTITRATPTKFRLAPKTLVVGDTVELLIFESPTNGDGDLVGAELHITLTH